MRLPDTSSSSSLGRTTNRPAVRLAVTDPYIAVPPVSQYRIAGSGRWAAVGLGAGQASGEAVRSIAAELVEAGRAQAARANCRGSAAPPG